MFLWEELDAKEKAKALAKDAGRVKHTEAREKQATAHKENIKHARVRPHLSFENIWREMSDEGGINLRDGWCRIFTLNRFGILQVNCAVRLEEKWLAPLSKEARDKKEMTVWPRGNLPKSNPWKSPHFTRTVVALPVWHEGIKQLSIAFDENLTYYFSKEIEADPMMEGMWTPRHQALGRPWKKSDGVKRVARKRASSFFQPTNYDLEMLAKVQQRMYTALQVKTHLIRKHRRERPDLIPMDVKETIEFWLEAFSLDPHNKR